MIRLACLLSLALLLSASPAHADFIVGPGDVTVGAGDQAYDLIAVDLNNPVTLAAGSYVASQFNYQFTNFSGYDTTGKITPLLLIGGGTSFTPITIGGTHDYAGATGFLSVPFGGADTFTLPTDSTVYAGLYWDATAPFTAEARMPVGYLGAGSTFVVYGGGTGPGANTPVVGTAISGSAEGFFVRTYDFSVSVNESSLVPEPSTLLLAFTGASLVGLGWLRRKGSKNQPTLVPL